MLSIKDVVFKEKPVKKLVDQYIGPFNKIVSINVVKLQLPTLMRIHLVVNFSQVVRQKASRETIDGGGETNKSRKS